MKTKNLSSAIISLSVIVFLSSCGSIKNANFGKRKYTAGNYLNHHVKDAGLIEKEIQLTENEEQNLATASENLNNEVALADEGKIEVSVQSESAAASITPKENNSTQELNNKRKSFATNVNKNINSRVHDLKRSIRHSDVANQSVVKPQEANILEIILAIFIPPLAVFLHDGLSTNFWIDLLLTFLFWVPGVVFAFLVVLDVI